MIYYIKFFYVSQKYGQIIFVLKIYYFLLILKVNLFNTLVS